MLRCSDWFVELILAILGFNLLFWLCACAYHLVIVGSIFVPNGLKTNFWKLIEIHHRARLSYENYYSYNLFIHRSMWYRSIDKTVYHHHHHHFWSLHLCTEKFDSYFGNGLWIIRKYRHCCTGTLFHQFAAAATTTNHSGREKSHTSIQLIDPISIQFIQLSNSVLLILTVCSQQILNTLNPFSDCIFWILS